MEPLHLARALKSNVFPVGGGVRLQCPIPILQMLGVTPHVKGFFKYRLD